jgi:ketose-bisphosphate aldolase
VSLVDSRELLAAATRGGYAVPAFNVHFLDMIPAVVAVAEAERSPVMLQVSRATVDFVGWDDLSSLAVSVARRARVPVVLHLDHAADVQLIVGGLRAGFSSVMADGSMLTDEKNMAFTAQMAQLAHTVGVPVEGELGHVVREGEPGYDAPDAGLTDPDTAARFVAETAVDSLAVAIGTVHGFYRAEPKLDFARLRAVRERVSVPLVLHGASGVPGEALQEAIAGGIAKVNIATELKAPWAEGLRQILAERPGEIDPRRILAGALARLTAAVAGKIRLVGAQGMA